MKSNRVKIISQSRDLFERFGYHKTTLTDIAKSVGKVKSAIYYYFSGKEEIFAELVRSEAEDFQIALEKEVLSKKEPLNQLKTYINTRVNLMEKVSHRYHFLKDEFFELMPIVEKNRRESDKKEIKMISQILETINQSNEFHIENTTFAAQLLMQNIKGLEVQMFVTDAMQSHNEDRDAFINFLLFGILKSKKS